LSINGIVKKRLEIEAIWLDFHLKYELWVLEVDKAKKGALQGELLELQSRAYAKIEEAQEQEAN
jgi:hypothetical protein